MAAANWEALLAKLRNGMCVPFLGAGACYPALPTGGELAEQVASRRKDLRSSFPFEKPTDLAKLTQFAAALDGDATVVKLTVSEVLSERVARVKSGQVPLPEVHKCLAQMKLPLYVTTNYDDLLEHALARVPGVKPQSEICRWTDDLLAGSESRFDENVYVPSPTEPVVFHLHGRWREGADVGVAAAGAQFVGHESMVLTEDDYLDFLVNISREIAASPTGKETRIALPLELRKAFRNKSLFFIGYSLADVNFLFILRALVRTLPPQPSQRPLRVAVQIDPKTLPQGQNQAAYRANVERYFEWTYGVQVLWRNADEIAADLRKRLELAPWPA